MREIDIRNALRNQVRSQHAHEPDTLILDELGLCQGISRVDIAAVNGSLHGYEIKSPKDTLQRLPSQMDVYGKSLDYVTLVTAKEHLLKAQKIVPEWWGLVIPLRQGSTVDFELVREPERNYEVDRFALVQLLWRDETLRELERLGMDRGVRSKSKQVLWDRLASCIELQELGIIVRTTLKCRGPIWRAQQPRMSDDDSRLLCAT